MEGVFRTKAGYAGGTTKNPTYGTIGDHSEAVEILYDPSVISYDDLLEIFWDSHSPTSRPAYRQYMSLILFQNDDQQRKAEESLRRMEERMGNNIYTEITSLDEFYPAEDYHQKYNLKGNTAIEDEIRQYYQDEQSITDSTAAARLNGYLSGYGTLEELMAEIDLLGLSENGKAALIKRFKR